MKPLIILVIILMFPISAMCGPFLTCDCTPAADNITGFQLQFGTATPIDVAAAECVPVVTDGKRIYYDLGTLPNGAFTVKALAKNSWGVSPWSSPLSDNKQLPGSPQLLKITP
jgi:hypothetical protein